MTHLSHRSMLVSLHQSIWQATAADRSLAKKAEDDAKAQLNTMTVVKSLAPQEYITAIKRWTTFGRNEHHRLTLPGLMKGQQLLPTKLFDAYAWGQQEIREHFLKAVDNFATVYPSILKSAPKRLGAGYRESDFPHPDKIKSYFSYEVRFAPVPETGNWLLDDVDSVDVEKIRNELENEKNAMYRDATKEIYDRARAILTNVADQIDKYDPNGSNGALLRDPTINSLKEMAELVISFNITGDPLLNSIGEEMRNEFGKLTAPEIRANADVRTKVAEAAAALIAKMHNK